VDTGPRRQWRSTATTAIPFEREPAIAVLTSYAFGPYADVIAEQAMQRVLLTATAEGLTASFRRQPSGSEVAS
jgi:hypothetical protein